MIEWYLLLIYKCTLKDSAQSDFDYQTKENPMTVSQADLNKAKQIGANGGTVNTNGMQSQDKQKTDAAVRQGQQGK